MAAWRFIVRMIKANPGLYAVQLILWTSIHSMPVLVGFIHREFFDRVAGDPAAAGVGTLVALLAAYTLGRAAFIWVGMFSDANFIFRTKMTMRGNLFEFVLGLPGARAVKGSPGEAISRMREDVEEAEDVVNWTVDLVGTLTLAVISFIVLARIDLVVTLLVFAPLLVIVYAVQLLGTRISAYREEARRATGEVTEAIGEVFSAVQAIKVAGAEAEAIEHLAAANDRRQHKMIRDRVLNEGLESLFWNSVTLGTGIILVAVAQGIASGRSVLTLGELALFIFLLGYLTDMFQFIGLFLAKYRQVSVNVERMTDLLQGGLPDVIVRRRSLALRGDIGALPQPGNGDPLHTLQVRGLAYTYQGSDQGIREVDLDIARGDFVVITGRIGSGKTTLLRAMLGLLTPQSGEVRWNGEPVVDPAKFFVPPHSAYTPQVPRLFSMALRDNLLLGLDVPDTAVRAAVEAAVMVPDVEAMEEGLDTLIGPLGVRLSGGQVQRTAAARMFVRRPQLMVFDDLSSALDVDTERILWARLFAGTDRPTCLVVSHRRAALQRASEILVLRQGAPAARGSLEHLLETSVDFRELWHGEEVASRP